MSTKIKTHSSNISGNKVLSIGVLSFLLLAVVVAGVFATVFIHADTTTMVSFQPETGAVVSPASIITDATASGGSSIQFGSVDTTDPSPAGVPGTWTLAFADEFDGTSLDTTKWVNLEGATMNGVTTRAANVSVSGGNAILKLSDSANGAEIVTNPYGGQPQQYMLKVGHYAEARVYFPGNGTNLYNWPAWWSSGPNWPSSGEHDIAEVLEGDKLTVNYHWGVYPAHNSLRGYTGGAATWGNAWHVFGVHRKTNSADVYWDGIKVASYATNDNGNPQSLILNIGKSGNAMYGDAGALRIDYVRAWQPAGI